MKQCEDDAGRQDKPPKVKNHCEFCEHKEVLHMILPRLDRIERKLRELEFNINLLTSSFDRR